MGWREQLQKASYRGVPFYVEAAGKSGGRRTAVHEFIARELPYAEDMGGKAKSFSISCYVLGEDYITLRDRLEAACEKGGPGTLVHPTRGTLEVNVTDYNVDERLTEEGGIARFTITFVESGRNEFPTSTIDSVATVDKSASLLSARAITDFADKIVTGGVSEFVRNSIREEVSGLSTAMLGVKFTGGDPQAVGEYVRLAQALVPNLTSLIDNPTLLATRIVAIMQKIRTTAATGNGSISPYLDPFINYKAVGKNTVKTPSQMQSQKNRDAVVSLVQTVAVAEKSSAAMRDTYDSYDDAIGTRNVILDKIDSLADTASDDTYQTLQDIRAQVVQSLPAEAEDLPRLASLYLPVSSPAVVLAYNLYDDTSRDAEIVNRNGVRHPGFLPANRKLQVLGNG